MFVNYSLEPTLNPGTSFRGTVLYFPPELCGALEAVQWTVRIRTAFAAFGGAAAFLESSSSGCVIETLCFAHIVFTPHRRPSSTGYVQH
jgi:hypothetical protein